MCGSRPSRVLLSIGIEEGEAVVAGIGRLITHDVGEVCVRILHLNSTDHEGGAYKTVHRLNTALRALGHDSAIWVGLRRGSCAHVHQLGFPNDIPSRTRRTLRRLWINRAAARYARRRPEGYEAFHDDRCQYGRELADALPQCDVINLCWVSGLVDYRCFFPRVTDRTPVVWTLADMNAFTGGCHYDDFCGKSAGGCGACPQLGSSDPQDLSAQIWKRKHDSLSRIRRDRLCIVATSRWMAGEVARSPILRGFTARVIPCGVDQTVFTPRDSVMARNVLGLPRDVRIVLFIAQQLSNRRKGFRLLLEALGAVRGIKNMVLVALGIDVPKRDIPIPFFHLGTIYRDGVLSLAYNAADVFVIPSLQDNLPNTVLEALSCGTPIAGFDTGGIPDMVRPGITGSLAPAGDSSGLAHATEELLGNDERRREMAENCRHVAVKEYSLELQAKRYFALYEELAERAEDRSPTEQSCS